MQGRTYISPEVLGSVTDYLQAESDDSGEHSSNLTPREREVLTLIADGKTTKEISDCLHLSERTVAQYHGQASNAQRCGTDQMRRPRRTDAAGEPVADAACRERLFQNGRMCEKELSPKIGGDPEDGCSRR